MVAPLIRPLPEHYSLQVTSRAQQGEVARGYQKEGVQGDGDHGEAGEEPSFPAYARAETSSLPFLRHHRLHLRHSPSPLLPAWTCHLHLQVSVFCQPNHVYQAVR